MGKLVGYARVSTKGQELDLQIDALLSSGCQKTLIFTDIISGAKSERPGLNRALEIIEQGDTLVVWRVDRLGRSLTHLVSVVNDLRQRGIGFRSISDGIIDTTSPSGEMVFGIFSVLAQFERRLIQERVKAGLDAARARGRSGGRPAVSHEDPRVKIAKKMSENRNMSINEICKILKVSKATYYRFLSIQ